MTPSSQSILKGHNIELGTKNEDEVGLATKLVNYGNANTKKKRTRLEHLSLLTTLKGTELIIQLCPSLRWDSGRVKIPCLARGESCVGVSMSISSQDYSSQCIF